MKIQKGMVKYKDRNDIVCVYGVTDDGKTYYFLNNDGQTFVNGNQVVSTELVEAIDPMYKASKVGVINSEGNVVIACENKGVKLITEDVILVEKAIPRTESVLQAIEFRSDSLHAAQLVSTPAQIKDNIYREMGNDGKFLFNDQFAEATICDINGNNLVDGDVYSFVAVNNEQLYLSKNTSDSPVVKFSLSAKKIEGLDVEVPVEKEQIDVTDVNVSQDVVENALNGHEQPSNAIQDNFDIDTHTPLENVNEGLEIPSADDFMAATNLGMPVIKEDDVLNQEDVTDVVVEEVVPAQEIPLGEPMEEIVGYESLKQELSSSGDVVEEITEEAPVQEIPLGEPMEEIVGYESLKQELSSSGDVVEEFVIDEPGVVSDYTEQPIEEQTQEVVEEFNLEQTDVEDTYKEVDEGDKPLDENDIQSLLDETSLDLFNGAPLQIDSIVNGGNDDLESFSFMKNVSNDSLFNDVAKSMSSLMKQNREQRATISSYEEVINDLRADKSELQGRITGFEHQNVELSDRNRTLENAVIKLKTRVESLAAKLHEKDEIIDEQARELEGLRPQLEGKEQLLSLLRDAQALISDDKVEEDEDVYSYAKVA